MAEKILNGTTIAGTTVEEYTSTLQTIIAKIKAAQARVCGRIGIKEEVRSAVGV